MSVKLQSIFLVANNTAVLYQEICKGESVSKFIKLRKSVLIEKIILNYKQKEEEML